MFALRWSDSHFVQLMAYVGSSHILIDIHIKDHANNFSLILIYLQCRAFTAAFHDKCLSISIRWNWADKIALTDGEKAATVQDLFSVFQIFISTFQFPLKGIHIIIIMQIIDSLRSENHGICMLQEFHQPADIFKISTGKTLWLNDKNTFYFRRFDFM